MSQSLTIIFIYDLALKYIRMKAFPIDGLDLYKGKELLIKLMELGGKASKSLYAESLNMVVTGGGFRTKISSLVKFGLIQSEKEEVFLTELGINLVNSYDELDEQKHLFKAFNNIPLFQKILERFLDSKLNFELLDKIFIRDYKVDQRNAKRLKKSFIESSKYLGILNDDGSWDIELINLLKRSISVDHNIPTTTEDPKEDISKSDAKNQVLLHNVSKNEMISNEIFYLISHLSSLLTPNYDYDRISDILERNMNLTHTNLLFKVIRKNLEIDDNKEENIKILLEGLKKDLHID